VRAPRRCPAVCLLKRRMPEYAAQAEQIRRREE